ncbi:Wzz/FepE/Etk N-terminal domain-containing protein [Guyparkeria halopsychrophila]|uniref:Wzz/FepE/Etk N-terminal domain-containing protein n=1 Tax=Guyparkeria halopsychrophila TaxID=3139421 RepID=UPI0037C79F77
MNDIQNSPSHPPVPPRFDDEIDLIDLGLALWHRRVLILVFLVLGLLSGVLAAQLQDAEKKMSAVVLVGHDVNQGEQIPVASTKTASSLLNTSLLPANARKHDDLLNPDDLKIQAKAGESAMVTIAGPVNSETFPALSETVRDAVSGLAAAIDNRLRSRVDSIESSVRQLELELESLMDRDRIEQERKKIEQEITNKENKLANREDDQAYLESEIGRLERMIELQTARAAEIADHLDELRDDVKAISVSTSTEAMTAMLLGNQIQSYRNDLKRANQQITVQLPRKINQARTKMAKAERDQVELQTEKTQAKLELKKFDREVERQTQTLQAQLNEKRGLLQNIQFTSLLNEPQMRVESGHGVVLFAALGLVLGGFVGLFAALMANFISAARERLHGEHEVEE